MNIRLLFFMCFSMMCTGTLNSQNIQNPQRQHAISESGKLAGPWKQQAEPLYKNDGGHGMFFKTFEGKIMLILHSPNNMNSRPRIFEMEDTGETLKVVKEFTGH